MIIQALITNHPSRLMHQYSFNLGALDVYAPECFCLFLLGPLQLCAKMVSMNSLSKPRMRGWSHCWRGRGWRKSQDNRLASTMPCQSWHQATFIPNHRNPSLKMRLLYCFNGIGWSGECQKRLKYKTESYKPICGPSGFTKYRNVK